MELWCFHAPTDQFFFWILSRQLLVRSSTKHLSFPNSMEIAGEQRHHSSVKSSLHRVNQQFPRLSTPHKRSKFVRTNRFSELMHRIREQCHISKLESEEDVALDHVVSSPRLENACMSIVGGLERSICEIVDCSTCEHTS